MRTVFSSLCFLTITGIMFVSARELFLDEKDSIQISLLPEADSPFKGNVTDEDKAILRYGFQRTHDCQQFQKAFICVRKCLDLDYQIAHADKDCNCTCYKNSMLAKYKTPPGSTKGKIAAPTTSLPPWAGQGEQKPNDYEINANLTDFIGQDAKEAADAAEGQTEAQTEGAPQAEGEAQPEGEAKPEGEAPADGATPAEGEATAAGETPAEGAAPAEGEAPAETEAPAEEAPAGGDAPAEAEPAAEDAPAQKR